MTIDQDKNIICGDGATAKKNPNSTEEGTGMIVIGNSAAATGLDSIALGTNAVATGDRTTAIGGDAKADHGGVAIGPWLTHQVLMMLLQLDIGLKRQVDIVLQ